MLRVRMLPALFCVFWGITLSIISLQAQKIVLEKGTPVVRNPKRPNPPPGIPSRLVLTEELTIGTGAAGGDNDFAYIRTVKADDSGNIYILDMKLCHVRVFDPEGRYLRTIGRMGDGPGEISSGWWLNVLSDRIMVYDQVRISYFSLDGEYIKSFRGRFYGLPHPDSDNHFAVTQWLPGKPFIFRVERYDSELNLVDTLVEIKRQVKRRGDLPFMVHTVLSTGNSVYGFSHEYKLMVMNTAGETIRIIKKDFDPVPLPPEEYARRKKRAPAGFEVPEFHPPVRRLLADDEGRLYVWTFLTDSDERHYYDVFDSEGRLITQLVVKGYARSWKNGKFYMTWEDEEGYHRVKRFRVRWE